MWVRLSSLGYASTLDATLAAEAAWTKGEGKRRAEVEKAQQAAAG